MWSAPSILVVQGPSNSRYSQMVESGLSGPGAYATTRRRVSRSIPDMPGLGPDLDLAAAGQGLRLTNCDWDPCPWAPVPPDPPRL
jgi:hypothetical protein